MKFVPRVHEYRVAVNWTGASAGPTADYASYSRDYEVAIEGKPPLRGSADPVFRGEGARHNPEELLLAALSACHMLSYLALCARESLAVTAYADSATATMTEEGGTGRFVTASLHPMVTIADDRLELAMELHHRAHEQCFIANSVNFPITTQVTVSNGRETHVSGSVRTTNP
jgi:organic hydroperoxide reductase OsmC/OhrA